MSSMFRVRTVFTGPGGTPWLSTFHFSSTNINLPPEDHEATAQVCVESTGNFWSSVDNIMSNTVHWATEANVDLFTLGNILEGSFGTTPRTGTGGAADAMLPAANQLLIRWASANVVNGRRVHGRTYVPGLTEQQSDNGSVSSTARTAVLAACNTLIGHADVRPYIWSVHQATATQGTVAGWQRVTGADVWSSWAVLRSRRD